MNPKVMESWFALMAEAMRGATTAQEAFKMFPQSPNQTEDMQRWLNRFMTPGVTMTTPSDFNQWYEDWCRMMGVVPRARYVDLLERYEILRTRLEEAEDKIRYLQSTLGMKGQEEEAKKLLDLWGSTIEKTLQAQNDWMRAWTALQTEQDDKANEDTKKKVDQKDDVSLSE